MITEGIIRLINYDSFINQDASRLFSNKILPNFLEIENSKSL